MADDMEDHGIIVERARPCMICNQPCTRIDIDFEAPLHLHPCRAAAWSDWALACRSAETAYPMARGEWI